MASHRDGDDYHAEVARDVAAWAAATGGLPEVDREPTRPVLKALEAAVGDLPGL